MMKLFEHKDPLLAFVDPSHNIKLLGTIMSTYKDINPKHQSLKSSAGRKKRLKLNFSASASSLSLLIRRTIKSDSCLFRNFQDL